MNKKQNPQDDTLSDYETDPGMNCGAGSVAAKAGRRKARVAQHKHRLFHRDTKWKSESSLTVCRDFYLSYPTET